jgi:hypothetical protein
MALARKTIKIFTIKNRYGEREIKIFHNFYRKFSSIFMVVLAESFSIKIIFPLASVLTFSFFFVSLCESVHNEIKSRVCAPTKAFSLLFA